MHLRCYRVQATWGLQSRRLIDSTDIRTVRAVRLLFDHIRSDRKPVVFWIGAGTSSWCGYPRWPELADCCHVDFLRYEPDYDSKAGLELLRFQKFPEFFQFCKDINSQRFYHLLSDQFAPRPVTPVYRRFIDAIGSVTPVSLFTTNVDELLEKNLTLTATVGRNDLERAVVLLTRGESFICKLHGSISDLRTMVFTTQDYDTIFAEQNYLAFLQRILGAASIVFVGYSLQDAHVLDILQRNCDIATLFGDGPHFAILPADQPRLPSSIKVIRYIPEPHKDHRCSISIVEEIHVLRQSNVDLRPVMPSMEQTVEGKIRSCHFLFDPLPPGRWTTSQVLTIKTEDNVEKAVVVGTGFTDIELPNNRSSAMHDFIVGLLCFDEIVAPIQAVGRLHSMLGSDLFWALIRDGILKFINWSHHEGVQFPAVDSIAFGNLESFTFANPDYAKERVGEIIREQLKALPGNEDAAERLFAELQTKIRLVSAREEGNIVKLVHSLLLRPSVRELLGISGGTPLNSLARWQVFPVLRLASVVKIGAACGVLSAGSAKLDFGMSKLAGPAFASAAGIEWTDETASYVISGRFNADLGELVIRDPPLLDTVRSFRDTQFGQSLRQQVLSHLAASEGAEVSVAVNAALRASIPARILQSARDQFVGLLISNGTGGTPAPAIWNDRRSAEDAIGRWRRRSRNILADYCGRFSIRPYDPCPCNSGEKLKFCCAEALHS